MDNAIRKTVRFAPSPTGYLHIGGARTALFNWVYARANQIPFILRIEDTDRVRSEKRFEQEILESLKWLGLDWDEIHHQSQRFDLYRQHARRLLDKGLAYQEGEAVLLKIPLREVVWKDLIRGEIVFHTKTIKDQVLIKSDGSPAYSFCCVIDDALMGVSPVIRGEDHISNTPKQILMYEALGFPTPQFAHLPLILSEEGRRLSKRDGAVAVTDYRREGFLPEALVNYLLLLGWTPGEDREIVSLAEAKKRFSLADVHKSGAVFSRDKLTWINTQYIKNMSVEDLTRELIARVNDEGIRRAYSDEDWKRIVALYQKRLPTLRAFWERADFFFTDRFQVEKGLKEKYLTKEMADRLREFGEQLAGVSPFSVKGVQACFQSCVREWGVSAGVLMRPVRVALTGKAAGPDLFEVMVALGQQRCHDRLVKSAQQEAVSALSSNW